MPNNPTVLSEKMSKFLLQLCSCYQNVPSFVFPTDSQRLGDRIGACALGANTIYMYRFDISSCFVSKCWLGLFFSLGLVQESRFAHGGAATSFFIVFTQNFQILRPIGASIEFFISFLCIIFISFFSVQRFRDDAWKVFFSVVSRQNHPNLRL